MLTQQTSPTYYVRLQFADAASCVDWLEEIPLADTIEAHEMVAAQIGLLASSGLAAFERMRILEVLYQPAAHLQAELARRYVGRPLPLSIVEYSVWNTVLDLWRSLFAGYKACFDRALDGDAQLAGLAPLTALRCIDLTSAAIREHHRVYREVPAALWTQLHATFAVVERHGLATIGIADPFSTSTRSANAAYGQVLLAHLGNPYTLSSRQIALLYRWAMHWGALISIEPSPPAPGMTSVLAVDLGAPAPAAPARELAASATVRYLGLEQLGQALRRTLMRLREGHTPASLGLGEDCKQPGTERLLTLLYIHWCGSGIGQLTHPRDRLEDARACVGLASALRQLEAQAETGRRGASAIRTAHGPYTEHWQILNVNAPGFIGVSRGPECDERIQHHQLIALKRRSASTFQLGVTQWLKLEEDGDLAIGVRMWPGTPQPIRISIAEQTEAAELSALLLPDTPEARSIATLILEPGVFRPDLQVTMLGADVRRTARLRRLAERGADFERVIFELLD